MNNKPLADLECEACKVGAPQVEKEDIASLMMALPNWEVIEVDGILRLTQTFKFRNFKLALAFTNRVGEMAEAQGHHPALLTEWGQVNVTWWSHSIKGLHQNDFVCAAKTDALLTS
ncbi:4a-hydroxytetrahydrobiopterin dehydratase [Vibrio tapetis]|uniref:Putative pterin-4-alpha-carbinolamine dehydratase n=1 Tax=Vibrio tapetis subsp. tapetis TaxID=1671868 RepID=A0A2N8ZN94_9VIBR|nr:4a-hydroxytetrahydrobiopterin dehydratase [Vibrio tapetis]SON53393.1 putative pterin-4-alpha-carbinolamine dehydratase [Vibrio tapetis subsp. tapetis]